VPPRKKTAAAPALTDADVKDLAFRIKGGDTPRVVVRTASAAVPAGTRGNVVRIGNPSEGEYIVVRLGRDEVPFAPSELSLPTRGRGAATAATAATGSAPAAKKTAAATSRPARSSSRSTASTGPAKATSTRTAAKSSSSRSSAPAKSTSATKAAAKAAKAGAPSRTAATKRASAPAAGRRRKSGRSPQPLTVTLRFADSRWTVEAQRGSRRIARAMPLRPGAVSAFAEHVDEEAVRDALIETVESCRAVVEEKAASLRAELDAAEASLREYDARRR
jgi:hypothetical protein